MATEEIINQLSEEAGNLRAYHVAGKLDLKRLDNFLDRVEKLKAPGIRKINNRTVHQLTSIRAKKQAS